MKATYCLDDDTIRIYGAHSLPKALDRYNFEHRNGVFLHNGWEPSLEDAIVEHVGPLEPEYRPNYAEVEELHNNLALLKQRLKNSRDAIEEASRFIASLRNEEKARWEAIERTISRRAEHYAKMLKHQKAMLP